jgi:hypothetical protein
MGQEKSLLEPVSQKRSLREAASLNWRFETTTLTLPRDFVWPKTWEYPLVAQV